MAFKPLYIDVVTRKIGDNADENVRRINYSAKSSREWLAKHCVWAFHNGYAVMTAKSENQEHQQERN